MVSNADAFVLCILHFGWFSALSVLFYKQYNAYKSGISFFMSIFTGFMALFMFTGMIALSSGELCEGCKKNKPVVAESKKKEQISTKWTNPHQYLFQSKF